MKTATVAQIGSDFLTVLKWVEKGEDVQVLQEGKPVAVISPLERQVAILITWQGSRAILATRCFHLRIPPQFVTLIAESDELLRGHGVHSITPFREVTSAAAAQTMQGISEPIPVTTLLAIEFRNALRLAIFRNTLSEDQRSAA